MAAGSKPTAVHFTLIFFVMLSLFLGVFAYMTYDDFTTSKKELAAAQQQLGTDKQIIATEQQEKQALIDLLGYPFTTVGNAEDVNSVTGAATADMRNVAGVIAPQPQKQNVREILNALAVQMNNKAQVAQQAQEGQEQTAATFKTQAEQQLKDIAQAKADQQKSEATLREQEAKFDEQLTQLRKSTTDTQNELRSEQARNAQLTDDLAKVQEQATKTQQQLLGTIKYQKDTINQLQAISFEEPDGAITLVDNSLKRVWINRGSMDFLRPQTTFSVYTKEHRGIARSTADVKAKIEVVRVDARSAECSILEEDLTRPIAPGDPIYTPLWQSGRTEKIAFVGIIDLDGDGKSDRDLLDEIMRVNHAEIQLQVLDDGTRFPPEAKLDVYTKFLVIGTIPNPLDFPSGTDEFAAATRMGEEHHKLAGSGSAGEPGEAEANGVQIVNLNEFLTWIGFRSQQRVFRPGQSEKWNLGTGSRTTAIDEVLGTRAAGGSTSELFKAPRARTLQTPNTRSRGSAPAAP